MEVKLGQVEVVTYVVRSRVCFMKAYEHYWDIFTL